MANGPVSSMLSCGVPEFDSGVLDLPGGSIWIVTPEFAFASTCRNKQRNVQNVTSDTRHLADANANSGETCKISHNCIC